MILKSAIAFVLTHYSPALLFYTRNRLKGEGGAQGAHDPPPPYFLQSLVFCNHFEELQTVLFTVELIINNTPLTYVYL